MSVHHYPYDPTPTTIHHGATAPTPNTYKLTTIVVKASVILGLLMLVLVVLVSLYQRIRIEIFRRGYVVPAITRCEERKQEWTLRRGLHFPVSLIRPLTILPGETDSCGDLERGRFNGEKTHPGTPAPSAVPASTAEKPAITPTTATKSTITLSNSTSFHTLQSLEDIASGIYEFVRGVDHACRSDLHDHAVRSARHLSVSAPASVTTNTVPAITVDEADLTDMHNDAALFYRTHVPVTVGHLFVPKVNAFGRLVKPKSKLCPRLPLVPASAQPVVTPHKITAFTPTTRIGPRRHELSSRGISKENRPLVGHF
jgi:hypothetical protein